MLASDDVIRAWKDKEYRRTLTPQEAALLPPHPASEIQFREWPDEQELQAAKSDGTVARGGMTRGSGG
jgi:mersacidin/lichenicidin family type 2 lantibiotic